VRTTIDQAAPRRPSGPAEVYLDDLRGTRDSGLIDDATNASKRDGYLDKV
jgi:hypothetical protein